MALENGDGGLELRGGLERAKWILTRFTRHKK